MGADLYYTHGIPDDLGYFYMLQNTIRGLAYHMRTLWLFTFSHIQTIVIPSTVFGICNALSAHRFDFSSSHPINIPYILIRLPLILIWTWINLLPFAINNQRAAPAIAEDAVNKPWGPLPSGRISPHTARTIMLSMYLCAQIFSALIGGDLFQGLSLVVLGMWYNRFGSADYHPLIRNGIYALGYLCFTSGAMEVALGESLFLFTNISPLLVQWLGLIAAVIVTTVHSQDLYDQKGDAVRGRRTLPFVIGDGPSRWILAIAIYEWGLICPRFWNASWTPRVLSIGLASLIGFRTLSYRDISSDKSTFLIWNIWVSLLYMLPLMAQ
ncbi:UbiA prenyltransferase family-domain-containing protein [Xylaria digitata]|nr:UbiA prenyltransferase family-domain-containing protein [Xylaria digitata]